MALKRIKHNKFISSAANGILSSRKIINKKKRDYYLNNLYELLNLIKYDDIDNDFKIKIPLTLEKKLTDLFNEQYKYIGIAPGAGEVNKIWPSHKFVEVAKYYEDKGYKIVLYLGPDEFDIKDKFKNLFPNALFPEEQISGYSNIEIVMGSTKFLSCALSNDSGISHMLSTKYCPLIKLFGPKDSIKFTPKNSFLKTITSSEFNSQNVSIIDVQRVLFEINKILN